ncbi:MAG: DUF1549 domain-containing protein [Acidobacteriota bacterium]|nr:MAG: DUF1549 domain-containing protein [Acidobacteriota bacterium]
MPNNDGIGELRKAWKGHGAKRLAAALYLMGIIAVVADLTGTGILTANVDAQQRGVRTRTVQVASEPAIASDCNFLQDPEKFMDSQARHRREISRLTESFSGRLERRAAKLVPAQDIPRKNLVDYILFDRMASDGIQSAPLTSDAEFLRRVSLDLTGQIPSPDAVTSFINDTNPYKRDILVDKLIASPEFVDKWTLFFGDLLNNNSFATNINLYIGGRESYHQYIRQSIETNKSYQQIATEMITATGSNYANGAVNFIVNGNVPMGPAQDTMDGLAVQTSRVFLGLSSMDCLLCHDGAGHLDAINLWGAGVKRADAWGMSAFFARTRRAFQRANNNVNYGAYTVTENATGEYQLNTNSGNRQTRAPINGRNFVDPKYLFGGGVNQGESRRAALARQITADPQFARAIVNYLWEEMMVEALVSPSDSFDLNRLNAEQELPEGWAPQPANPQLLEALTAEIISNGYNLRHIIGLIAKSNAYQLSTQYPGEWRLEYVPYYARKYVRRLDAEEIHDAIVRATGQPPVTTFRNTGSTTNQTILGYPVMGDDGIKIREVLWAGQLPEPREPRQNGTSRNFLDSFLRGNRDGNPRTSDSSILQALNLMNNTFVNSRIHNNNRITNVPNTPEIPSTVRRLLSDTSLTPEQLATQLYLHTLSRYPTDAEKARILPYYSRMSRLAATESLQWVLLNKVDFIFNY